MSSLTSTGKEEEPICLDYGDDSDDDSEVIVIDTTPTMLAEKISADSGSIHDAQEEILVPSKRRRVEETTESAFLGASRTINNAKENEEQDEMPSVQETDQSFLEANMERDQKFKEYASVFEGCNSYEPIEIDDDSDEDENDCNVEDGKTTIESLHNPTKSFITSGNTNPPMPEHNETTAYNNQTSSIPELDGANQLSSAKLTDEMRKGNVPTSSTNDILNDSCEATIPDSSKPTTQNSGVASSNEDITETLEAEIAENTDASLDRNKDARNNPQPSIEVIDLADDDDDDDDDDDSSNCQENQSNEYNSTRSNKVSQSQPPEIEVIDVDEIEDSASEMRHDKLFREQGELDKRNTTKPRFKPNKNNKPRKGEMFENLLRRHREDLRNRAMQNNVARSNRDSREWHRPKPSPFTEKRFVFHPSNGKPGDHHTNSFLGMNIEDARKEQERLLQQAANRVRNQPSFHVTNDEPIRSTKAAQAVTFSTVVRDVHMQFPDHFKYRDFYSRLGLPRNADESTIKSQYRRLARVYHPDRNIGKADTKHKFQAVTEAYNQLLQPRK